MKIVVDPLKRFWCHQNTLQELLPSPCFYGVVEGFFN